MITPRTPLTQARPPLAHRITHTFHRFPAFAELKAVLGSLGAGGGGDGVGADPPSPVYEGGDPPSPPYEEAADPPSPAYEDPPSPAYEGEPTPDPPSLV